MATGLRTPLILENLSSAPSSPAAGWSYFDTTRNQVGVYNGTSWGYLTASGSYLRAPTIYAPGTAANLTTTSTTFAAVSTGSIATGSFTAPASGEVIVTVELTIKCSSSVNVAFALGASPYSSGALAGNAIQFTQGSSVTPVLLKFPVTSLTPGSSYNYDLLFAVVSAATLTVTAVAQTATTITSGNAGGPAVVTTQAV